MAQEIEKIKYLYEISMDLKKTKSHYYFKPLNSLFTSYKTSDILLIDEDPIVRSVIIEKLKNTLIKRDSEDIGRKLNIQTTINCEYLIKSINDINATYGFILLDNNDETFDCINKIRNTNYKGPIFIFTGKYLNKDIIDKYKLSGADGIIHKNLDNFIKEINKIIHSCISRDINFDNSDDSSDN